MGRDHHIMAAGQMDLPHWSPRCVAFVAARDLSVCVLYRLTGWASIAV